MKACTIFQCYPRLLSESFVGQSIFNSNLPFVTSHFYLGHYQLKSSHRPATRELAEGLLVIFEVHLLPLEERQFCTYVPLPLISAALLSPH
mgnify:CR=1 FL=1